MNHHPSDHNFSQQPPTWLDLVAMEPRLAELEFDVLATVVPSQMPDYWQTWSGHKQRICDLVGWLAPLTAPRELRTSKAYEVVFDHLLDVYQSCAYPGEIDDDA